MNSAHVYFIEAKPSHRVKIGWAVDPDKRIKQLQTGNPETLEILGTIAYSSTDEARSTESAIHKALEAVRIGQTEWFKPSPDLFAEMADLGIVSRRFAPSGEVQSIKPPASLLNAYHRDKMSAKATTDLLLKKGREIADTPKEIEEFTAYSGEEFYKNEISTHFHIGHADFNTRHVLYLLWEAAKYLCGMNYQSSLCLLEQAVGELKREIVLDRRGLCR